MTRVAKPEPSVTRARPSVFILCDIRLYREGLAWSLSQHSDVDVVGAGGPEAIEAITSIPPSAVLLDIVMPAAFDLAKEINRQVPAVKIIAFALNETDHDVIACARAGIVGYVTRNGSVEDVVNSIRSALNGELICSPRIAGLLFQRVATNGKQSRKSTLTSREREILNLINRGLSNKQIARSLRVESATVKNHVHNILEKLQLRRRGEAAAWLRGETAS